MRNWGNEGICGPNDEPLKETRQIAVRLPATRLLSSNIWVAAHGDFSSVDDCYNASSMSPLTSDGKIVFTLPPASIRCSIVGDLTTVGLPITVKPADRLVAVSRPNAALEEDDISLLRAKVARLSPGDRQLLAKQLSDLTSVPSSGTRVRAIKQSNVLPQVSPSPVTSKKFEAIPPDPASQATEAKRQQLIDTFLKAHGIQ